ncbi:MAG: hypothetical protein M1840_006944 [Geoglossum simile]|nr:MAG: hypothetical protein M1840_006944 [Geoglossum simile]
MRFTLRSALLLIGTNCAATLPKPNGGNWTPGDTITRDVVVIGGGSSGTYAAIRLRDMNQSVVVVEHKDRLGGHTETYTDPVTQAKIDIGVLVFHNTEFVKNYFARFNVTLTVADLSSSGVLGYSDFRSGATVNGHTPTDPSAALGKYAAELAKYPYLGAGYDLPDPVPVDLLLPFADFVTKYGIQAAVKTIFDLCQGHGDVLSLPTIYVMKLFSLSVLSGFQAGFLTTAKHDNSELYDKAQAALGAANALLLDSRVVATDRDADGGCAQVVVSTPSGWKLIKAKKILVTVPPTLKGLVSFGLDTTERSLFQQFRLAGYYTGLLRHTGIPDNTTVVNIGANTPYNLPPLPGVYSIGQTGVPGLHSVTYGSDSPVGSKQAQKDIIAAVQRLKATLPTTTPEFAVFSNHSPFLMWVPSNAIAAGFYRNLGALQGHRRTFYTGAAFHTHDSSALWEFTEALLPSIIS